MNWETYIAFGDSITIGARTYLGYPETVGGLLEQKLEKSWNVINCAKSGFTAIDLARHIDLCYNNIQEQQSSISTILIGTNDVKSNTSVEDYETALNLIVLKVKLLTQNNNVVLIELPKFMEGIMYPYSIEMNKSIELFNQSIEQVADKHQIKTLSFEFNGNHFVDGVHLNNDGTLFLAKSISDFILKERGL